MQIMTKREEIIDRDLDLTHWLLFGLFEIIDWNKVQDMKDMKSFLDF